MEFKAIIYELIKKSRDSIDKSKYDAYMSLTNKLKNCLTDNNELLKINDEDLMILNDSKLQSAIKSVQKIITLNLVSDKNEIITLIKNTLSKIEILLNNDEEIKTYFTKIKELEGLYNIVNNNFKENEDKLIDFLSTCLNNGMIDIDTFVKLVFYITEEKTKGMNIPVTKDDNQLTDTVDITENNQDIKEELITIFSEQGYDYSKLDVKIKSNLEKYGKVAYARRIVKLLKDNNLSETDLLNKQKAISKLMIFEDTTALATIEDFINNNNCTLNKLLSFESIFYHRTKKFNFKNKSGKDIFPSHKEITHPSGSFESFLYCVDLYKKSKKLPADYKMTDADFGKPNREDNQGLIAFFTTPKEIIEKNLNLLRNYGYISGDDLPTAITALIGKNTEYILDRLIESGLYEYGKKYPSVLTSSNFPFRWYKIKRSHDFGENLFAKGGLRSELKKDERTYDGIDWKTSNKDQIITQEPLSMDRLVSGEKQFPTYKREEKINDFTYELRKNPSDVISDLVPDKLAEAEFHHFYQYTTFTPQRIFKYKKDDLISSNATSSLIGTIFDKKDMYEPSIYDGNDEYIKLLDESLIHNGTEYTYLKVNNLTYRFYRPATNEWPEVEILISRLKVIRLINLLKKENVWIDDNMSNLEKENLLLSVLVKDSILSMQDMNTMRIIVTNIINSNNNKLARGV